MNTEQIIAQLRSLIEDAESHREKDGTLDEVYQKDVDALRYAMVEVKRRGILNFCHKHSDCFECPLNGNRDVRGLCVFVDDDDEDELDTVLKAIKDSGEAVE